jgi:hypothetical protein
MGPYGAPLRKVSGTLYLVCALLIVVPLIDFTTSIVPYLPGSSRWRFASGSVFSGFLLTPLLGIALAMLIASLLHHRRVLKLLMLLSVAAGLLLLGLSALLALDVIELRAGAEGDVRQAIVLSGARGLIKNGAIGVSFLWIAVQSRRALWLMEPPRGESPMAPIVGSARR